jgi:hypothetical protein
VTSKVYLIIIATLLCESVSATPTETSSDAKQQISSVIGLLLQAEGVRARDQLRSLNLAILDAKDANFRSCVLSRLNKPTSVDPVISPLTHKPNRFAQRLLSFYRAYWWASVMQPEAKAGAERRLAAQVSRLFGRRPTSLDDIEPLIENRLKQGGFRTSAGQTGKLYERMIWSRQDEQIEKFVLPDEVNETRVYYLNDFVSLGWSNYLSCDRTGTGGWTDESGLYVVVPNYDSLTDENFRVNFLAHESQHFADKRRYKKLADWELEYRAKLVEVAYAVTITDKMLSSFSSNQGDDIDEPHSYANKKLLIALRQRLHLAADANLADVPVASLHDAALAELRADSAMRVGQLK